MIIACLKINILEQFTVEEFLLFEMNFLQKLVFKATNLLSLYRNKHLKKNEKY